jgi:hypothetical protein
MAKRGPTYSEQAARAAVAASLSYAETLRRLELCPSGGAHLVLKKYLEIWAIPTDHFDPYATHRRRNGRIERRPLEEILVQGSEYPPWPSQAPPLRGRLEAARLRALRARRALEGAAHVADPRSRQRHPRRQPFGEPEGRVSKLRRHAGNALWAQEQAGAAPMSSLRRDLSTEVLVPALLLSGLRLPTRQESLTRAAPRRVEGRTTDPSAADG